MEKKTGYFVISLDFELFWGMSDVTTLSEYGENVCGERTAIPRMLELFIEYGIHATWATVGMLMARDKNELLSVLPREEKRPHYSDKHLSSYYHMEHDQIGANEHDDPYHFGPSLVSLILSTPHQELANHTFSHYYCMDGDQKLEDTLGADLDAHARITDTYRTRTQSIIFPRNQVTDIALRSAHAHGMRAYRGNENHFLYRSRDSENRSYLTRALRLIDHYINISGYHTYPLPTRSESTLINIPASRFLRPFMKPLAWLEPIRMRRIKNAMTHAAKNGEVFHLWWHPHNFGVDQDQNFKNLTEILEHYRQLNARYNIQSTSMGEITTLVDGYAP
jgi:peptidoglycan/xylan/chitin deacetylase (PgdA/CDA1 family)